jgi:hypothetical protein
MAAALLALLGTACSDEPTAPRVGTIHVAVRTSGGDVDADGYLLIVGGTGLQRTLGTQETVDVRTVAAGPHIVTLASVAANCTVNGEIAQWVSVESGRTIEVKFEVVCVGTGVVIHDPHDRRR